MSDTCEVRGLWKGSYRYSAAEDIGASPFKAKLVSKDGQLSGMVVEPHLHGNGEVKAKIEGTQDGATIRFEKRYLHDHEDYSRVIDYEGQIAADGATISGTWRHSDSSGTFEMSQAG